MTEKPDRSLFYFFSPQIYYTLATNAIDPRAMNTQYIIYNLLLDIEIIEDIHSYQNPNDDE